MLSFAKERFKEPTVPRSNPPLDNVSCAEQTKKPTVGNEFCEEEGPREPRFPSKWQEQIVANKETFVFVASRYTTIVSCRVKNVCVCK